MKAILFLILSLGFSSFSYSQTGSKYLTVFFVNQFDDSIHIFFDEKNMYQVKLKTEPSLGQCEFYLLVPISDSTLKLTFYEILNKKKFETVIKKAFSYLYVYKLNRNNYQFDYSNKLLLPE